MAMFTPAQKPRGLARMIFTIPSSFFACMVASLRNSRHASAPGWSPNKHNRILTKTTTPPVWVALIDKGYVECGKSASASKPLSLLVLNFGGMDPLFALFLGNRPRYRPFLGFHARVLVVLLVARLIEPVDGFLDLDDSVALLGEFEVALGTGDRALEDLFLLVFRLSQGEDAQDHSQTQSDLSSHPHRRTSP